MKQTQMYVCTLEEFILVAVDTLLCNYEVRCQIEITTVYIQRSE